MTTKELENYEPKGELIGFPKEIIARMLECQEEQGNKRDITVFEKNIPEGFIWNKTKEGGWFWYEVITEKNFDLFFEKYPKKEDNQEFRVGDKVIDIILNLKGKIINIKSNGNLEIQFEGKCGLTEYNLKIEKRASLLHYRDDYDYDVIDFNNLPKRQEYKRWRAENGRLYSFVDFNTKNWLFPDVTKDDYLSFDNNNYNSGNYFQTKKEAQEIADKLNRYFNQLINTKK